MVTRFSESSGERKTTRRENVTRISSLESAESRLEFHEHEIYVRADIGRGTLPNERTNSRKRFKAAARDTVAESTYVTAMRNGIGATRRASERATLLVLALSSCRAFAHVGSSPSVLISEDVAI